MTTITFEEWARARVLALDSKEASTLARHSDAIRCEGVGLNRFRVGPMPGFVGSIALSRDTLLLVKPRLAIDSFAALLSLAYDEAPIPVRPGNTSLASGDLSSWCISQIVAEGQRLFRHHLRPGYVALDEKRTSPRGRLVFNGDSPDFAGRIRCVADEFNYDTALNRFIKAGLVHVRDLAIAMPWRAPLSKLVKALDEVQSVPASTMPRRHLGGALLQQYRSLATLLNLAIENEGSEFAAGDVGVSAFFFRLHDLFERAVYAAFRRLGTHISVKAQPQDRYSAVHIRGTPNLGITFRPDLAIGRPTIAVKGGGGKWILVVDAKYRPPVQKARFRTSFRNDNIYQIMAYCRAFDAPGLLLYPQVDDSIDVSYRVSDARFNIRTVDLRSSNLSEEFKRQAESALEFALEQ